MTNLTMRKTRVAFYLRVSSDEQRERQTIKTQEDILKRWKDDNQERIEVVGWFMDDGVSGTKPMEIRPQGKQLSAHCLARAVDQVVVCRMDRLGRTSLDLLQMRQRFDELGVSIFAVLENVEDPFEYELRAVLAAEDRRRFLKRSQEGMTRAAREGRYCGGIVPLGYMVEGTKHEAHLVPSDRFILEDWAEPDLVRQMFHWGGIEEWSTVRMADYLNALGVPTSYTKDGRLLRDRHGERTLRTQNLWRPGRIRNLLVNPVYKGVLQYGRRTKRGRDVITAAVPALVSPELWQAAQDALSKNRLVTKHGNRINVLRSLMHCTICTLSYCAYRGARGVVWYRCGGQTTHRGKLGYRCPSRSIRADFIEPIVRSDVERFLLNPDPSLVEELQAEAICTTETAAKEAERLMAERALAAIPRKRDNLLELRMSEIVTLEEAKTKLDELRDEEQRLQDLLAELDAHAEPNEEPLDEDLIVEIKRRAEDGFDDYTWREVIALLVAGIDVVTEVQAEGKKKVKITIRYRFPGVPVTDTGTRASQNYTTLKRVVVV